MRVTMVVLYIMTLNFNSHLILTVNRGVFNILYVQFIILKVYFLGQLYITLCFNSQEKQNKKGGE